MSSATLPTPQATPVTPITRLLHLEDSEPDHELAMAHLRRFGMAVLATRVESRQEFAQALAGEWDLILSDYNLPDFAGAQRFTGLDGALHRRAQPREIVFKQVVTGAMAHGVDGRFFADFA